ncbi:DUF3291 domain-containing protein [Kribbella sp. NBC_00889]|uniref:DUF3291 domain-containing protein n=1 Tax=Kribbella sp. NBC_00889 TaxID=2975974 RepID=UPI00386CC5B3|nr:DUF3291 domain-containing protein [Kribbella sp. NBC_00889]
MIGEPVGGRDLVEFDLAQVNVARMRAEAGSPLVGEFVAALDPVNRLADQSPGFVWRLPAAEGHVLTHGPGGARDVVNLSVWSSYEDLHAFVYRSAHGRFVLKRSRWFEKVQQPSTALWWLPAGEHPTVEDALARLDYLRRWGPSRKAFTVRRRYDPTGLRVS